MAGEEPWSKGIPGRAIDKGNACGWERNRQAVEWWSAEPAVGRLAHGIPKRVDQLKCLGNAVVPFVSKVIGDLLWDIHLDLERAK